MTVTNNAMQRAGTERAVADEPAVGPQCPGMEDVTPLDNEYDRRNRLLFYEPNKDQHLLLLDPHARSLLSDAKTASELSRHLGRRLKAPAQVVDEYIARRWLACAEARGVVRQESPELWRL